MGFFDFFKGNVPLLVQEATRDVATMLDTTRGMFVAATGFLVDNAPLEVDLYAVDRIVNQAEHDIRQAVFSHVTAHPGQDMVFGLLLMSIVQDAERIGDLTKSLAEIVQLAHHPRKNTQVSVQRILRDRILTMFDMTREGFVQDDAVLARRVMTYSAANKEIVAQYLQDLADSTTVPANMAVVLGLSTRIMGRLGSHLSNIASTVALPFPEIRRSVPPTALD